MQSAKSAIDLMRPISVKLMFNPETSGSTLHIQVNIQKSRRAIADGIIIRCSGVFGLHIESAFSAYKCLLPWQSRLVAAQEVSNINTTAIADKQSKNFFIKSYKKGQEIN